MSLTWKRASELPIDQLIQVWNKSFEGYFVDMTMTVDQLQARFNRDQISLERSIVGFFDSEPVGLIMNAFQAIRGQNVAWNGGTAIIPKFRDRKLGRFFMEQVFKIYQKQEVQVAFLEALAENTRAIRLYQRMGYEIIDRLHFYSFRTVGAWTGFTQDSPNWIARSVTSKEVSKLCFYQHFAPWQTQWDHIPEGKGMILELPEYGPVAYALYRLATDEAKAQTVVTLYQVGFHPDFQQHEEANEQLIHHLFASHQDSSLIYTTVNLSERNHVFIRKLQQYGFTQTIEQVYMKKVFA